MATATTAPTAAPATVPSAGPASSTVLDRQGTYRLSRWISLRPTADGLLAESLLSGRTLLLDNRSRMRLFFSFLAPLRLEDLLDALDPAACEVVLGFLEHCHALEMLSAVVDEDGHLAEETEGLKHWEFHDLYFHVRSRRGLTHAPVGATFHLWHELAREPVLKPRSRTDCIELEKPDLEQVEQRDPPLTRVLETRRSRYGTASLDLETLGEFLYRTFRVTSIEDAGDDLRFLRKVYPSGGSLHSLDLYLVAKRCWGLPYGMYHYRPLEHQLTPLRVEEQELEPLLVEARRGTGGKLKDLPSILFILTTRFRRVAAKYESLAYSAVLKEVGVVYQTMYLVGTAMGLSPCAVGAGDTRRFARVTGIDYHHETSVGEFVLGGSEA
jgi:SagB-type dehydrogenase family enzyme